MRHIKRPLVAIVVGSIIGIIYGLYLGISIAISIIILILLLFYFHKKKQITLFFILKRRKLIFTILISFIFSFLYTLWYNNQFEVCYKNIPKQIKTYATIISEAKETNYYKCYEIKIKNKKFLMYTDKNSELKFGMYIKVIGEYKEPQERRNYKGFDYKEYLKTKRIYGTIMSKDIEIIKGNNLNYILILSNNTRNKIIEISKKILSKDNSTLLSGLLVGEKKDISEEIRYNFSRSNLAHILAISGTHISYIIIGISFILNQVRSPKKVMHILTILILIFFIFITRFSPSVIRASIMAVIMLCAKLFYRKSDILNSMAISLLIILINNPLSLNDISLQLSYLATLGIVLFNTPITNMLSKKLNKKLSELISITISAQILILPIIAVHMNTISTIFIISNIIAMPLVGTIIIFGYINILIGSFSIHFARMIGIILNFLIEILNYIAKFIANIPFSNFSIVSPGLTIIILYYIFIILLYKYRSILIKYAIPFVCCLIIIIVITLLIPQNLQIFFVDVGQRRLYSNKNTNRKKYSS